MRKEFLKKERKKERKTVKYEKLIKENIFLRKKERKKENDERLKEEKSF